MNIESPTLEGEIEWIFQNAITFHNQFLHFIDEVRGRSVPDFYHSSFPLQTLSPKYLFHWYLLTS